jgi:hypothetical protein
MPLGRDGTLHLAKDGVPPVKHDRLSISMTKPQILAIRSEAQQLGVSIGEVVRRALDAQRGAIPWAASSRGRATQAEEDGAVP